MPATPVLTEDATATPARVSAKPNPLLGVRRYEWLGHTITIQRAGSNNESALQLEPHCSTCSLPYAIAEAVKFMNRFSLHTLQINKEDAIRWTT